MGPDLAFRTDGEIDSHGQLNRYRSREHGYVDRIRATYQNHETDAVEIEVAVAVPKSSEIVDWQLPDGATETDRAPQSVIANLPDDEFDQEDILGRQSEFDFHSFDVPVAGRTELSPTEAAEIGSDSVAGSVTIACSIDAESGEQNEMGIWILGSFAGGSGSSSDPYQIETWEQLNQIRDGLSDSYELITDLGPDDPGYDQYAGPNANGGDGWEPLDGFSGTLDGGQHEITGLYIDRDGEDDVGFIGEADDCEVFDLGIRDAYVRGNNDIGALGGVGEISIDRCWVEAEVHGGDTAAIVHGSAGGNAVEITESVAAGSVESASDYVGSFWGFNFDASELHDSYSNASVSGTDAIGGLIGYTTQSNNELTNSYFAGELTATDGDVGGVAGEIDGGTYDYLYWDTDTSGTQDAFGDGSADSGTQTGLETDEMQGASAETEMDGLDYTDAWDSVEASDDDSTSDGYPILQSLPRVEQLVVLNNFGEERSVSGSAAGQGVSSGSLLVSTSLSGAAIGAGTAAPAMPATIEVVATAGVASAQAASSGRSVAALVRSGTSRARSRAALISHVPMSGQAAASARGSGLAYLYDPTVVLGRMHQTTKSPYVVSEPLPPTSDEPAAIPVRTTREPLVVPDTFSERLLVTESALDEYEAVLDRMRDVTKSPYAVADEVGIGGFGVDFGISFGRRR